MKTLAKAYLEECENKKNVNVDISYFNGSHLYCRYFDIAGTSNETFIEVDKMLEFMWSKIQTP